MVMKSKKLIPLLILAIYTNFATAQSPTPMQQLTHQGPPPQAYEDCKGKKAGDTVQHTTPEGKVAATCVDTPAGLAARPTQARGMQPGAGRQ
jgi:hypothetical protein